MFIIKYTNSIDYLVGLPTGTCGQDPMFPLIAPPLFFTIFNIDFFFHINNILQHRNRCSKKRGGGAIRGII